MTTGTAPFPHNIHQRRNLYTSVSSEDNGESESLTEWHEMSSLDEQQSDTDLKSQPGTRLNLAGLQWLRSKINRLRSRMPTGWHFGAWMATFEAGVVLLINLIILLVCAVKTGGTIGAAQMFEGDCNTVDNATLGIHLVINVLSTLLLSASNYVMQSLSAPTRAEVDRAHEKGFWLDIGLQSMHNLKHTSRWKRRLWALLCISSIPVHLFYNSSFFSTTSANDYNYYIAQGPGNQDFLPNNGTFSWECSSQLEVPSIDDCSGLGPDIEPANWKFLSPSDCLQAYAVDFLSNYGDIVVVIGDYTYNNTFLYVVSAPSWPMNGEVIPFGWICEWTTGTNGVSLADSCSIMWKEINPSNWTIGPIGFASLNWEVQYCLVETIAPRCQLQFNLGILAIVVAFNIVKVTCIAIVATRMRDNPLVTLGDAIASFTNNPEPLTKDMCLMSQSYLEHPDRSEDTTSLLIAYQPQKTRWMTMASRRHWILIGSLFLLALCTTLGFLGYAINKLNINYGIRGLSSLWQLGIGRASSENIITAPGWAIPTQGYQAIIASVLLANIPQLIFSMIYLVFNSLCTKLFLALEWSSYAHSRKPLRVSDPHGDQRSTYFLNIPFRFGFPLMVYSVLLHWLLSQSIFVVAITAWNGDVVDTANSVTSCGFSPAAMVLTAIVGGSLILSSLAVGYFKHLQCDMPLAGSCSKAIAAACHPPEDGSDPLKPMKWGVVSKLPDRDVWHISFSSGEVAPPVPGCYYE